MRQATAKSGKKGVTKQQPRRRAAKRVVLTSSVRKADPKSGDAGGAATAAKTKIGSLITQLRDTRGASLSEIADATGWQHHSIRGAISGHIKKKLGLNVASVKDDEGVRRYRIAG